MKCNEHKKIYKKISLLCLLASFFCIATTNIAAKVSDCKYSLGLGLIGGSTLTFQAFNIYKAHAIKNNLPWSYQDFVKKYPRLLWQAFTTQKILDGKHPRFCAAIKLLPLMVAGLAILESNNSFNLKKQNEQLFLKIEIAKRTHVVTQENLERKELKKRITIILQECIELDEIAELEALPKNKKP